MLMKWGHRGHFNDHDEYLSLLCPAGPKNEPELYLKTISSLTQPLRRLLF